MAGSNAQLNLITTTVVPVLPQLEEEQLVELVNTLKRNMIHWIEHSKQMARLRREAYNHYIVEGFTPEQALILCQNLTF